MINGVHTIVYAQDAERARSFFRDTLGFTSVDAGSGWLIFALPTGELAAHPADGDEAGQHRMYLMCDDIHQTVATLKGKGVEFVGGITDRGWGLLATMQVPGLGELSIYEPKHPTAI